MNTKVKYISICLLSMAAVGCSSNFVKPGASQAELEHDFNYCKSYAEGKSPISKPPDTSRADSVDSYHSGTIYKNGEAISYSGTSRTYNNPSAQDRARGASNIIGLIGQVYEYNSCMESLGYVKQ